MPNSVTSTRRELLLEQMAITQYELRRPMALRGEVAIAIPPHSRLIMIAQQSPDLSHPLLADIIQSMSLSPNQLYYVSPEQAVMLPANHALALWLLGNPDLPETLLNHELTITSPELAELASNPAAKRILWQQICHHENYFALNL